LPLERGVKLWIGSSIAGFCSRSRLKELADCAVERLMNFFIAAFPLVFGKVLVGWDHSPVADLRKAVARREWSVAIDNETAIALQYERGVEQCNHAAR
jgi:hypothetical protein